MNPKEAMKSRYPNGYPYILPRKDGTYEYGTAKFWISGASTQNALGVTTSIEDAEAGLSQRGFNEFCLWVPSDEP